MKENWIKETLDLKHAVLEFSHIVDRHADMKWQLEGPTETSNLILVYEGQVYVESDGQSFIARKGDMVYFKRGSYRRGYTFEHNPMKCLSVNVDIMAYDAKNCGLNLVEIDMDFIEQLNTPMTYGLILKSFQKMVTIWEGKDPLKAYRLNSEFMLVLRQLVEWKETNDRDYRGDNKVSEAIDYMKHHINESIKVSDVSDYLQISASYLSRIFKEKTGQTLINYFNEMKIEQSKKYLAAGHSIGRCAQRLGFKDLYYYSKVFKQYEGVAPSVYARSVV